jgi:hypothetical protein
VWISISFMRCGGTHLHKNGIGNGPKCTSILITLEWWLKSFGRQKTKNILIKLHIDGKSQSTIDWTNQNLFWSLQIKWVLIVESPMTKKHSSLKLWQLKIIGCQSYGNQKVSIIENMAIKSIFGYKASKGSKLYENECLHLIWWMKLKHSTHCQLNNEHKIGTSHHFLYTTTNHGSFD